MAFANRGGGSFRLYDFESLEFVGPVKTRVQAEQRKAFRTRRKRDALTNWYRLRVHAIRVESDGKTLTPSWRKYVASWRERLKGEGES